MREPGKPWEKKKADFGREAEKALVAWIEGHGYKYTEHPDGKMGIDGLAECEAHTIKIDADRKRGWDKGPWPFEFRSGLHVPERKGHFENTAFISCRADIKLAMVGFSSSFRDSIMKSIYIKERDRREWFFDIPLPETLPVDLKAARGPTLAEMNANRVRKALRGEKKQRWDGDALLLVQPFGVGDDEFERMQVWHSDHNYSWSCETHDNRDAWLYGIPDEKGRRRTNCRHCGEFVGFDRME